MKYQIVERTQNLVLLESNSLWQIVTEFFTARKIVKNLSIKKTEKK